VPVNAAAERIYGGLTIIVLENDYCLSVQFYKEISSKHATALTVRICAVRAVQRGVCQTGKVRQIFSAGEKVS
jgi:hypothetical protein